MYTLPSIFVRLILFPLKFRYLSLLSECVSIGPVIATNLSNVDSAFRMAQISWVSWSFTTSLSTKTPLAASPCVGSTFLVSNIWVNGCVVSWHKFTSRPSLFLMELFNWSSVSSGNKSKQCEIFHFDFNFINWLN